MVSALDYKSLERLMLLTSNLFLSLNQDGTVELMGGSWKDLVGYDSEDLKGKLYSKFFFLDDRGSFKFSMENLKVENEQVSFYNFFKHKEGHYIQIGWSGFWAENKMWLVGDIAESAQKVNGQDVSEDVHRIMVEHCSDMLMLFDSKLNFIYSSRSTETLLGYSEDQLNGDSLISFIHPNDVSRVQEGIKQALISEGNTTIADFRLKHATGEWKWIESTFNNQFKNPEVKALISTSRIVTEGYASRQQFMESEQHFRSLFDDNPCTVLTENERGDILNINKVGALFMGTDIEKIVGSNIAEFLPPEAVTVCLMHLKGAFKGNPVSFTLETEFEGLGRKVFDIKKIPVSVSGKVLAVHTVINDVTAMANSQLASLEHAEKLSSILESITDAFFTLDKEWNFTYINKEAERLISLDRTTHLGKNIWDVYPNEIEKEIYQRYHCSVNKRKAAHFEAYFEKKDKWLEIKVFPTDEGLSVYFSDITQRIKTQHELEKLSLVANHTTNGVVISDANRRIEWVNKSFTKLTGYSLEEAVGHKPFELLHMSVPDVSPFESVREQMLQGHPISLEIECRKKDGNFIWLLLHVNPIIDENGDLSRYVTIQTDITDRKRTQLEMEKLSRVASKTDNGVIITDAAGYIEWVNDGFTRITGYTMSDSMGKKPGEFLQGPETNREDVRTISTRLKNGEHFNMVLLNYKKTGEKYWISMDITPIHNDKDEIIQFIAIQKDITSLRDSEYRIHKMSQDLFKQNNDLQQFTYIVSHNLRAPVANALGLSKILTSLEKNSERYDQSVNYLHQSMLSLNTVLNDMNTILSIRDKKETLDHELVDVCSVLDQVLHSFQETLIKCGCEVENSVQKGLGVKANKAYLYSVFHNLLSNAIKYRSDTRALKVSIQSIAKSEKGALISFSDNGVGFDTTKAANDVFKLYKRFHADRRGRGIGLYLVKTHLEAMGGYIEVSSKVNSGTKFLIFLAK